MLYLKNCQWLEPAIFQQGIGRAIIFFYQPFHQPPHPRPVPAPIPYSHPSPQRQAVTTKQWKERMEKREGSQADFRENGEFWKEIRPFLPLHENH